jgi:uncharacterized repeat protein (TIGR03806 family)
MARPHLRCGLELPMRHIPTPTCAALLLACLLSLLRAGEPAVTAELIVSGLTAPVQATTIPGDTRRLCVIEKNNGSESSTALNQGRVRMVDLISRSVSTYLTVTGLDTSTGEEGLLGIAFHPQFATNGYLYVHVTSGTVATLNNNGVNQVRRYTAIGDPLTATAADPATMQLVLEFPSLQSNHNGGFIGFGPDGFLYVATGDGGASNDAGSGHTAATGNAQDRTNLLGKMLRLDVDNPSGGRNYGIPAGNPFAGNASGWREEIWHFGLRNPWACSFDPGTSAGTYRGDLWIGDVGQGAREEIDYAPAGVSGRNYGWRPREGLIANPNGSYGSETPVTTATNPVTDHVRSEAIAIIGGSVYRGSALPALDGWYFYQDYGTRKWWRLSFNRATETLGTRVEITSQLSQSTGATCIVRGPDGELYFNTHSYSNGGLYRIIPAMAITTAANLGGATTGSARSIPLAVSGATGAVTWSVTAGTLPAGMTLSTGGTLSGTPTTPGTAVFTVRATDSQGTNVRRELTLVINPAVSVTTTSLANATRNIAYNTVLAATGGTGALAWSISSGALPTGLSLGGDGAISGTPTTTGASTAVVRATDTVGASATRSLTLTVIDVLTITTTDPLPGTTVGRPTTRNLAVTGGTAPYAWAITSGSLPAGMTLASNGTISGTPSTAGIRTITVRVDDNTGASASATVSLTVNPVPAVTTASLPAGTVGAAYAASLAASGGTAPIVWTIASGTLPAGLALAGGGAISGTPSAAGTANLTVRATDAAGAQASRALSLTIGAAPVITSTPVTTVNIGIPYATAVSAAGTPAPSFALTTAPSGMTIGSSTGAIAWTPTAAGAFAVTVTASNGTPPAATQSFTITVTDYGLGARPAATAYLGGTMPTDASTAPPSLLSAVAVFSNTAALTPAASLIPYGVISPLWSDGADKGRWISLATGSQLGFTATGAWSFPAGTAFVKHFELALDRRTPAVRRRLETRVLVRTTTGAYGRTWRWNNAGTDATRVDAGTVEDIPIIDTAGMPGTQRWFYPGPTDCMTCHTPGAGHVLGASTRQFNSTYTYPSGVTDNQLRTWSAIGMFTPATAPPPSQIAALARLVSPADLTASAEARARSYLDANCSHCHLPGGTPAGFDARFDTPLASQNLIDGPVSNALGIPDGRVIAPGSVERSIAWQRMHSLIPGERMPPLGSSERDTTGLSALADWIASRTPARRISLSVTPTPTGPLWAEESRGGQVQALSAGAASFTFPDTGVRTLGLTATTPPGAGG